MSDKPITTEEMVKHLVSETQCACTPFPEGDVYNHEINCIYCEAIRKHLEKPEPRVRVSITMEDAKFLALIPFVEDLIPVLKSMNIEVSDNSEVGRRTSDKEGE